MFLLSTVSVISGRGQGKTVEATERNRGLVTTPNPSLKIAAVGRLSIILGKFSYLRIDPNRVPFRGLRSVIHLSCVPFRVPFARNVGLQGAELIVFADVHVGAARSEGKPCILLAAY